MIDRTALFPQSMDFIPMLDKTDDLVERGLASAQNRWEAGFAARNGVAQPKPSAVPERTEGTIADSLA